jgi:hypothetical protein
MTKRAELRQRINKEFALDEDVDEFLIDYCNDVWRSISRGMSRKEKINHLFASKDESEIEQLLNAARPESAAQNSVPPGSYQDGSAVLRQEITRLQQIIQDLEQQLSGVKSEPSIAASNGLRRLQQYQQELISIIDNPEVPLENDWIEIGHKALNSLEGSLGKFSTIVREFRYRFLVEKRPISRDYLPLINAAIAELQQDVDEERGAADALYGAIRNNRSRKSSPWL